VLEANAKVTPPSQNPLSNQFKWRFKYITTSAQGIDVKNLVEIEYESAHARKKRIFRVDFVDNISIYLSIYPVLRQGYRSHYLDDLNA